MFNFDASCGGGRILYERPLALALARLLLNAAAVVASLVLVDARRIGGSPSTGERASERADATEGEWKFERFVF